MPTATTGSTVHPSPGWARKTVALPAQPPPPRCHNSQLTVASGNPAADTGDRPQEVGAAKSSVSRSGPPSPRTATTVATPDTSHTTGRDDAIRVGQGTVCHLPFTATSPPSCEKAKPPGGEKIPSSSAPRGLCPLEASSDHEREEEGGKLWPGGVGSAAVSP